MYFIASHARFDDTDQPGHGTGSELSTYLRDKKEDYVFIRHSLYNGSKSEVEFFVKGKEQKKHYGFKNLPFLVRVVMEQLITFWLLLTSKKKVKVFIGIDPLNGLSGIFGRFLGKVDKAIFYTADYSKKRFENSFLNTVYHQIDLFCVKYADQVWNVSSRITSLRKEQGVEDSRNFFVPNTPEFKKAKRASLSKKNLYDLVIVSTITKTVNYPAIIRAVKKLSKKFKKIRLLIVGDGEYVSELKSLVKKLRVSDRVLFLGRKPHNQVLEILSESGIGIALYSKEKEFSKYGDSMKVREYLACGLPVVMNDIPSTADDVKSSEVGIILKGEGKGLEKAIEKLFSDRDLYKTMQRNALFLAESTDFTKVVDGALSSLS